MFRSRGRAESRCSRLGICSALLAIGLTGIAACRKPLTESKQSAEIGEPVAAESSPTSSPTEPTPKRGKAFEGTWSGAGIAVKRTLPSKVKGGVQVGWIKDKGARHVGTVSWQLVIAADGDVRGNATGELGELVISGYTIEKAEAFRVNASVRPSMATPKGFAGTLACLAQGARQPPVKSALEWECQARLTSGDGNLVRVVTGALKKGPA